MVRWLMEVARSLTVVPASPGAGTRRGQGLVVAVLLAGLWAFAAPPDAYGQQGLLQGLEGARVELLLDDGRELTGRVHRLEADRVYVLEADGRMVELPYGTISGLRLLDPPPASSGPPGAAASQGAAAAEGSGGQGSGGQGSGGQAAGQGAGQGAAVVGPHVGWHAPGVVPYGWGGYGGWTTASMALDPDVLEVSWALRLDERGRGLQSGGWMLFGMGATQIGAGVALMALSDRCNSDRALCTQPSGRQRAANWVLGTGLGYIIAGALPMIVVGNMRRREARTMINDRRSRTTTSVGPQWQGDGPGAAVKVQF